MLAFGPVYCLVGVAGFLMLGGAAEGHLLGIVHINQLDNFLHLDLGIGIGAAGLVSLSSTNQPELEDTL